MVARAFQHPDQIVRRLHRQSAGEPDQGKGAAEPGVQLGQAGNPKTFLDIGAFISGLIYFIVFMAVLYLAIVIPYKYLSAKRRVKVFGAPGRPTIRRNQNGGAAEPTKPSSSNQQLGPKSGARRAAGQPTPSAMRHASRVGITPRV